MNESQLMESARNLAPPPPSAVEEFGRQREVIAARVNQIMLGREDLDGIIGPGNRSVMEDNHRNHGRFMHSLFVGYEPQVFVETVLWVFRSYRSHGFRIGYWPTMLGAWVDVMREQVSPETFEAVHPFYEWLVTHHAAFFTLAQNAVPPTERPRQGA